MTDSALRAIGGAIITELGSLDLADARELARIYAWLAGRLPEDSFAARLCRQRGGVIAEAVEEASRWRRAAGWTQPDQADQA